MVVELGRLVETVQIKKINKNDKEVAVLNNRIAIPIGKGDSTYIDITAWGSCAEYIERNFVKGDQIYLEGELRNKKSTIGDKTIQEVFISVITVKLTYGRGTKDLTEANANV